jgi:hypothetical protein
MKRFLRRSKENPFLKNLLGIPLNVDVSHLSDPTAVLRIDDGIFDQKGYKCEIIGPFHANIHGMISD